MTLTRISKSQARAVKILGITDTNGYTTAAEALTKAGFSRDGIPSGHTWRSAAQLSDAELMAALGSRSDFQRVSALNLAEYGD